MSFVKVGGKNQNLGQSCALQTVSAIWISNPVLIIEDFLYLLVQRNLDHKFSMFHCRQFCGLQTAVFILVRKVERDALLCHSDSDTGLSGLHVARLTVSGVGTIIVGSAVQYFIGQYVIHNTGVLISP
jgi:hypothetical protein